MIPKIYYRLIGANHFKHKGDKFFLDNNFDKALGQYRRARLAVGASDYRAVTLDALIRECALRVGEVPESVTELQSTTDAPFVPGLSDFFKLAIADKPKDRLREYQGLGEAFEAGYVSLVRGDAENAVRRLEEATRKSSASFVLQLELGRALSLGGDMDRARIELEKAYQLRPKDRELQNLLAAVDIQLGRFENAVGILEPLVQLNEDIGPETAFLLGRALAGLGMVDQAMERFKQTVELDSRFHEAFFEGAKLLKERGDVSGALRLLRQACSLVPDEISYNRELARLVLDNEIEEEIGLEACDRLMVTDEENQWRYLSWIAELYVRRGWKGEARDPLRKALELCPRSETVERRALERRLADLEGNSIG